MHTLARNKKIIYYATLTGKEELIDDNGDRTGQYELTYSEPQEAAMNIRWNDGAVQLEGFGLNDLAKRRMVTDDMNCPIDIGTILWIGIEPEDENGNVPHNYVVAAAPQRSLNHIVYIVEEVSVGNSEQIGNPIGPIGPLPFDPTMPVVN